MYPFPLPTFFPESKTIQSSKLQEINIKKKNIRNSDCVWKFQAVSRKKWKKKKNCPRNIPCSSCLISPPIWFLSGERKSERFLSLSYQKKKKNPKWRNKGPSHLVVRRRRRRIAPVWFLSGEGNVSKWRNKVSSHLIIKQKKKGQRENTEVTPPPGLYAVANQYFLFISSHFPFPFLFHNFRHKVNKDSHCFPILFTETYTRK